MALRMRLDEPLRLLEIAGREGLGELRRERSVSFRERASWNHLVNATVST